MPLRAANARTLIEQSIGRGLRLPYGRKTGVEAVDRLNIIAHDRFQEVINDAGRGDSPIRLKQLVLEANDIGNDGFRNVSVTPTINTVLGIGSITAVAGTGDETAGTVSARFSGEQANVAKLTLDIINEMSRRKLDGGDDTPGLPTSAALAQPAVQARIVEQVAERMTPAQTDLLPSDGPSIADIVAQTVLSVAECCIDIPRILVKPKGNQHGNYQPFKLDISRLNVQPIEASSRSSSVKALRRSKIAR